MKLYYSTGSCSMSCVIGAFETGTPIDLLEVSWTKNQRVDELNRINPLGVAPALVLDNGEVLTQNIAILEHFADQKNSRAFLPAPGSLERARVMSWLSFVASDLHKAFVPLFAVQDWVKDPKAQGEVAQAARASIKGYLEYVEKALQKTPYIAGQEFSAADAYLYVVLGWCQWVDIPLNGFSKIETYMKKVAERPSVAKALALEE